MEENGTKPQMVAVGSTFEKRPRGRVALMGFDLSLVRRNDVDRTPPDIAISYN